MQIEKIFPDIRQIGCFYHYCRNIREKAIKYGILKKDFESIGKIILNELYSLPFKYYKNKNDIIELKDKYKNKYNCIEEFLQYFETQWLQYYENGMLNYKHLSKEQRSNSYIENYNRRIKLKLSKYLYGKNKCIITWPFLYFIKKEEEDYKNEIFNLEKELLDKNKKITKFKKTKKIFKIINEIEEKNIKNKIMKMMKISLQKRLYLGLNGDIIHVDMIRFLLYIMRLYLLKLRN